MSLSNIKICVAAPFISVSVFVALLFAFNQHNPLYSSSRQFDSQRLLAQHVTTQHSGNHAAISSPSTGADAVQVQASASQAPASQVLASQKWFALPRANVKAPALDGTFLVWHDDRKEQGNFAAPNVWGQDLSGQSNSGQPFQITSSPASQRNPDISGQWVVYEDFRNGSWDISATNLATSQVISVALAAGQQRYPKIAGDYIVYQDDGNNTPGNGSEADINLYQISTGTTTVIANGPGYQGRPDIDNGQVVWSDLGHESGSRLGIYNIETQATTFHPIQCNDKNCRPRINNGEIVWHDARSGNRDLYLYSIQTLTETAIITGAGDQLNPAISNDLIVWQDQESYGNWNIFALDRATGATFPLSLEPSIQIYPAISTAGSTYIAWEDNRNHTWDLYGFTWNGQPPNIPTPPLDNPTDLVAGAYPGEIRLRWTDTTTTETNFVIQRAEGIFGTDWQDYFTMPANGTQLTDRAVTPGQTYWYRVRATGTGAGSNVTGSNITESLYTNESYNTAIGNTPSPEERHLLVLINEARMAPGAWGHPTEEPTNPVKWQANLSYSARAHAHALNNSDCCQTHIDLALRNPSHRAAASGYPYGTAENLYLGISTDTTTQTSMDEVNQGLMDSGGHRRNMLNPIYKEAAVGYSSSNAASNRRGIAVEVFSWGDEATVIPALPSGIAVPLTGTVDTEYTYLVSFWNEGQVAPTVAQVIIDGQPHPLTLRSGLPGRGTYAFSTVLALGSHTYFFQFEWGSPEITSRLPQNGTFQGPYVRDNRWYVNRAATTSGNGYLPEQPFKTIQEAINVAQPGDTIQVATGLYEEKIHIPDGVHLQGAGRDITLIRGDGTGNVVSMGDNSELSGFAVLNSGSTYWDSNIWVENGNSVAIRESLILSGSMGISNVCFGCPTPCQSTLELTNNIIVNHTEIGVNSHCALRAINNTVAGNSRGIHLQGSDITVKNNIVLVNSGSGIWHELPAQAASSQPTSSQPVALAIDVSYNNVWQNGVSSDAEPVNYHNITPGPGSLTENPGFVDLVQGDLRLMSDSVCVDAGDPDPQYNDGNGTRNDMGSYGGPKVNAQPVADPSLPAPTATVPPSGPTPTATALNPTVGPTAGPTTEPTTAPAATSTALPTTGPTLVPTTGPTTAPTTDPAMTAPANGTPTPTLEPAATAAPPQAGTPLAPATGTSTATPSTGPIAETSTAEPPEPSPLPSGTLAPIPGQTPQATPEQSQPPSGTPTPILTIAPPGSDDPASGDPVQGSPGDSGATEPPSADPVATTVAEQPVMVETPNGQSGPAIYLPAVLQ